MTITKLVFVDTETLSLPRAGVPPVPWEVAWITAELWVENHDGDNGGERTLRITGDGVFQPMRAAVHLADADPMALRISHFYERYWHALDWECEQNIVDEDSVNPPRTIMDVDRVHWERMAKATVDHWWVGACPDFDEKITRAEMLSHGLCLATHYHLIDAETHAAGHYNIPLPWTLKNVMRAAGVERSSLGEHTAMGDTVDCVRLFAASSGVTDGEWQSDLAIIEKDHASS